jgi:hypothetical protein
MSRGSRNLKSIALFVAACALGLLFGMHSAKGELPVLAPAYVMVMLENGDIQDAFDVPVLSTAPAAGRVCLSTQAHLPAVTCQGVPHRTDVREGVSIFTGASVPGLIMFGAKGI